LHRNEERRLHLEVGRCVEILYVTVIVVRTTSSRRLRNPTESMEQRPKVIPSMVRMPLQVSMPNAQKACDRNEILADATYT
jgi:hypothetical protein